MTVPPFVRIAASAVVDDLAGVERLLAAAAEAEWVSDAASLYAARLGDASRAVAGVGARARAAEESLAALEASA